MFVQCAFVGIVNSFKNVFINYLRSINTDLMTIITIKVRFSLELSFSLLVHLLGSGGRRSEGLRLHATLHSRDKWLWGHHRLLWRSHHHAWLLLLHRHSRLLTLWINTHHGLLNSFIQSLVWLVIRSWAVDLVDALMVVWWAVLWSAIVELHVTGHAVESRNDGFIEES